LKQEGQGTEVYERELEELRLKLEEEADKAYEIH